MKSTTRHIVFSAVVLGAFALSFGYALSKSSELPPQGQPSQTQSEPQVKVAIQEKPAPSPGQVLMLNRDGGATKIQTIETTGLNTNLLYSDKSDQDKFKAVAGLHNDGSELYLVVGSQEQEFSGKLISITTDGKAKVTTIRDMFTFTAAPVVAGTGDKLARIEFHNDEQSFGFSVIVESFDSNQSKTVYTSSETISTLDFSLDGSRLALVKSTPTGGGQIVVVDLATETNLGIYSTPGTILSLDYEKDNVILSEAPAGSAKANEAELVSVDPDGKNVQKLTANSLAENTVRLNPDSTRVAYISAQYPDGVAAPGVSGNLVVMNLQEKTERSIGKSTGVIGWLK